MEIRYVPISATVERESMALKAAVLPILMREMTIVKIMVKMIEFTGKLRHGTGREATETEIKMAVLL